MWYFYWKRAGVQDPFFFYLIITSYPCHSLILSVDKCSSVVSSSVDFVPSLSAILFCLTSLFVSLTLVILNPVWKCLLSATLNHWVLLLVLVSPVFLFCWHNLLMNCLVLLFCLIAVFCYLGEAKFAMLSTFHCVEKCSSFLRTPAHLQS